MDVQKLCPEFNLFSDRIMTVSESFEECYFLAINVDVQVFCEVKLVDGYMFSESCS